MQLKPFAPGSTTVGGQIAHRMQLTAEKILHHCDIDGHFARHYRQRKEVPEVPGGFTGYGMLLDAVVKAAAHGVGGEEMVRFKQERLRELLATMTPDGNISIYKDTIGLWDNHDQAYLIQALVLDHRYFGEKASLEAAVRLADYLMGYGSASIIGLEAAFVMLYQETGDERLLDYCRRRFQIEATNQVYEREVSTINGLMHVYSHVARNHAQLLYAQATTGSPSKTMQDDLAELWRRVFSGYSSISGTCSGGFHWGEIWDNSQLGVGPWGETCVSAYLLRMAAKTMEFEGLPCYGDLYERIMYNALWGAQAHDGLRQRYFSPFNEEGKWYDHDTYCCPNNFRRIVFEIPDSIYLQAPDGIAVNLYNDATLTCALGVIAQKTRYPMDGDIQLQVTSKKRFALYVRIPQWCKYAQLDTGEETIPITAAGWYRLERQWHGTTTLHLRFDMPPRLVAGFAAQRGKAAIMRGPQVYALDPTDQPQFDEYAMDSPTNNGLHMNSAGTDIATIDAAVPLKVTHDAIEATCLVQFGRRQRFILRFTPFYADNRMRTYFPVTDTYALCRDELYDNAPKNETHM